MMAGDFDVSSGALSTKWRCTAAKEPPETASTLAASIIEPPPSATITSGLRSARPYAAQELLEVGEVGVGDDVIHGDDRPAGPFSDCGCRRSEELHIVGDERPASTADMLSDPGESARAELDPNRVRKSPHGRHLVVFHALVEAAMSR